MTWVRLLAIPRGADRDSAGRALGDDWLLAKLGEEDDVDYYLTTDGVHASRMADLPGFSPRELGAWLVEAINEQVEVAPEDDWPYWVEPEPVEPPESAWVDVDGVRWATNGAVLVREGYGFCAHDWMGPDGVRPLPTAESMRALMPAEPTGSRLRRSAVERSPSGGVVYVADGRSPDVRAKVAPMYAPIVDAGDAYQPDGEEEEEMAIYRPINVWIDGTLAAIVMPMRWV